MKRIALGLLALSALGLIGTGLWMLSIPVALIAVGGLVWLDLSLSGLRRRQRTPRRHGDTENR